LKRRPVLIGSLILALLANCARMSTSSRLRLDDITIDRICARVEKNYHELKTMKARAQFMVESPKMNFQANSQILIQKPDSLHITLRAPFGLKVGSIFLDRHQFILQNSWDNIVYTGQPDSLDLSEFLPIDIHTEQVLRLFAGIQTIEASATEPLSSDGNRYVISGVSGDKKVKYWIDSKRFVVTACHVFDSQGEPWIQFEYSQIEKLHRVFVPKIIRISQPAQKTRLTIFFSSRELNRPLQPEEFVIQIPPQSEVIKL